MLTGVSERLLPMLQLTRMALVFTAVSNSLCTYLLAMQRSHDGPDPLLWSLRGRDIVLITLISIGLYGFGMSLNDIIDRRRDQRLAAHRPIPSGRIGLVTAHIICVGLALVGTIAAGLYSARSGSRLPWMSLGLALWTAALISLYDLAGKYLAGMGLLLLGLIRFFHALIPAPQMPLVWHPLFLFAHVSLLSALAYAWEQKRPELTRLHRWMVAAGTMTVVGVVAGVTWLREMSGEAAGRMPLDARILLPLLAAGGFALLAWHIRRTSVSLRDAGQALMLNGLLWLIIYDSAFTTAYVGVEYGLALLSLLPISYLAVQFMRWWSKLVLISQSPEYRRIRPPSPPHDTMRNVDA